MNGSSHGVTPASSTADDAPAPPERRPGTPQRLVHLYRRHLIATHREDRFLAWSSFSVAFLIVRLITHSIRDDRFRWLFHNISGKGGRHIHHLVFGIAGLLGGGYSAAGYHPKDAARRRVLAVLFGTSAALTVDEFALWLDLEDVYWAKQGRISVDAAVLLAALMGAGAAGRPFFRDLARDLEHLLGTMNAAR